MNWLIENLRVHLWLINFFPCRGLFFKQIWTELDLSLQGIDEQFHPHQQWSSASCSYSSTSNKITIQLNLPLCQGHSVYCRCMLSHHAHPFVFNGGDWERHYIDGILPEGPYPACPFGRIPSTWVSFPGSMYSVYHCEPPPQPPTTTSPSTNSD